MNRILFTLFILFILVSSFAQKAYFQQEVNYTIDVSLNDKEHYLNGKINIEYLNNSPDTLSFIYIHLWPNAYKNNKTALARQLLENGDLSMEFMSLKESGWIDSLSFETNGESLHLETDSKNIDVAKLILKKPLLPHTKISISTPFRVKIPSAKLSRLGHIGQAYAITQWYPKPAVYDRFGWHPLNYLDQGEFYSEFGSFEVRITLPENYIVGATGDLTGNVKELEWLNNKVKATEAKNLRRIELKKNYPNLNIDTMSFPPSSENYKTLIYRQSNVHDFAWFADKRFNVIKDEIVLPRDNHKVTCWAMFTDNNFNNWLNSPEYLKDAIKYYSQWNGNYPYNQVTAIDGTISAGGGMEYPNITIIGETENSFALENVIMHEVGHNWFYGILGSNERNYAWLDEGINSFNELRYNRTKYPQVKIGSAFGIDTETNLLGLNKFKNAYQYYLLYALSASNGKDQVIQQPSEYFTEGNYGAIVYSKTAITFDYLFHYLGQEKFDSCMKTYFEKYKFKHPYPEDLRGIFENITGKNLDFIFNDLIGSNKKIDYKFKKTKKNKSDNGTDPFKYILHIKNKGDINSPILISAKTATNEFIYKWYDGFKGQKNIEFYGPEITEFRIDPECIIPELNRRNNYFRNRGIFRRINSFKFRLLGNVDHPNSHDLNYIPVVAYNKQDGWMAGINLSNYFILGRKFQFDLTPMYGFGSKQLSGIINAQLNLHGKHVIQNFQTGFNVRKFTYNRDANTLGYLKLEHFEKIQFKNANPRSKIENSLIWRLMQIRIDKNTQSTELPNSTFKSSKEFRSISELIFSHYNNKALNPYNIEVHWQTGNSDELLFFSKPFSKIWIESNFHLTMNKKNNGFDFRFFAGKIFSATHPIDTRFRMGGIHGYQDYAFDYFYLDRNASTGFNYQQYIEEDGAFKTRMFVGQSSDYLIALNIKSPKFLKFMRLFADLGHCGNDGILNDKILADFGLGFEFFKEGLSIYLPLLYSKDIMSGIEANGWNFGQRIMINMKLEKLNPKNGIKSLVQF